MKLTKEYLETVLEAEQKTYQKMGQMDEVEKSFFSGRIDMLEDLIFECEQSEIGETRKESPNYFANVVSNLGVIGFDFYSPKGPESAKEDAKEQFEQEYPGSTVINVRKPIMYF